MGWRQDAFEWLERNILRRGAREATESAERQSLRRGEEELAEREARQASTRRGAREAAEEGAEASTRRGAREAATEGAEGSSRRSTTAVERYGDNAVMNANAATARAADLAEIARTGRIPEGYDVLANGRQIVANTQGMGIHRVGEATTRSIPDLLDDIAQAGDNMAAGRMRGVDITTGDLARIQQHFDDLARGVTRNADDVAEAAGQRGARAVEPPPPAAPAAVPMAGQPNALQTLGGMAGQTGRGFLNLFNNKWTIGAAIGYAATTALNGGLRDQTNPLEGEKDLISDIPVVGWVMDGLYTSDIIPDSIMEGQQSQAGFLFDIQMQNDPDFRQQVISVMESNDQALINNLPAYVIEQYSQWATAQVGGQQQAAESAESRRELVESRDRESQAILQRESGANRAAEMMQSNGGEAVSSTLRRLNGVVSRIDASYDEDISLGDNITNIINEAARADGNPTLSRDEAFEVTMNADFQNAVEGLPIDNVDKDRIYGSVVGGAFTIER